MRPFIVCMHDVTPVYASETRTLLDALGPLVGRRLSCGVVPDWHGAWPLTQHADFCRTISAGSDELLLHGYRHQRARLGVRRGARQGARGWGPITLLAEGSDEMNGLDAMGTRDAIERGQRLFVDAFGTRARGFLAPAWQRAHVRPERGNPLGVDYVVGFFSLQSCTRPSIPLATSTWDCGRWRWLGHVGDRLGRMMQALDCGVPVLAIHPRDLARGYLPAIVRLCRKLLDGGYEPTTSAQLLDVGHADVPRDGASHVEVAV